MAARDPVQQGAAIQRRAQAAQQNFAQQLRFELGVQERFGYFLESFDYAEEPSDEGGQEQRRKRYREKVLKMAERGKNLLEVTGRALIDLLVDTICPIASIGAMRYLFDALPPG
jgi:hypothetical protein